jgi:hypothetical protein
VTCPAFRLGMAVQPTKEAITKTVFGREGSHWRKYMTPVNPGVGYIVSMSAMMPGCIMVQFDGGKKQVNTCWLEPAHEDGNIGDGERR